MIKDQKPANVFSPGEFLRDELEARGWTQRDLADVLGRPLQTVNQIINAKKRITPETAVELASALGTSAGLWLNLESAYRLAHVKSIDTHIARRAKRLLDKAGQAPAWLKAAAIGLSLAARGKSHF